MRHEKRPKVRDLRPWQSNDDNVLVLDVIGDVDRFRIRESLEEGGGGKAVAGGDVGGSRGASVEGRGSKSSDRGGSGQEGGSNLHGC